MAKRIGVLGACLVASAAAGCAAGSRLGVRPDVAPPRAAAPATSTVARAVAQINRNAEPVDGLTASAGVSANRSRFAGGITGQLSLERPRNFKMSLEKGFGSQVVDLGSNSREFWFWINDAKDAPAYVGRFDASGRLPDGLLVQPDWIVEAMGLRPIDADEAASIRLTRSDRPGHLLMTHRRADGSVKRTEIDEQTLRVTRHDFYAPGAGAGAIPVAVVTPSSPRSYTIEGDDAAGTRTVELPQTIEMKLRPSDGREDELVMVLGLRNVHLNPPFTEENRQALFTVPRFAEQGRQVVELESGTGGTSAEYATGSKADAQPAATLGTELRPDDAPGPLGIEGASLRRSDPTPLEADLPGGAAAPAGTSSIVRRTWPHGPGAAPAAAEPPARRVALGSGFLD